MANDVMAADAWILTMQSQVPSYDPYDLWATRIGLGVRKRFYSGRFDGKIAAFFVVLLDWWIPKTSRRVSRVTPKRYPIVVAHDVLRLNVLNELDHERAKVLLESLVSLSVELPEKRYMAWGLGFPWLSKNGFYPSWTPFITHTPYVMEALLVLSRFDSISTPAKDLFDGTWNFLQCLCEMKHSECELALSYAPLREPRIVVNANAYAAYAYALHSKYGDHSIRAVARKKAIKLSQWVTNQQNDDGSWYYYADKVSGNFIDCFHSCFTLKNLLKVRGLIPEAANVIDPVTKNGWSFICSEFFDSKRGLCLNVSGKKNVGPYKHDLYDQAEYLGLLLDFGGITEAGKLVKVVEKIFRNEKGWYCKIDVFGRKWGRQFERWGISPWGYQFARYVKRTSV